MADKNLSSKSEVYENVSVEVYYAESMPEKLRTTLSNELDGIYHEKYTSPFPRAETSPVINITKSEELKLLIGDEISLDAINEALDL